jgi:hypothetical protein
MFSESISSRLTTHYPASEKMMISWHDVSSNALRDPHKQSAMGELPARQFVPLLYPIPALHFNR